MSLLLTLVVLLGGAVLAVPATRRLGLGSVAGYLVAGIAIGPAGLGLVRDVEAIAHASELGVVMLLFLIGLELRPQRLWLMRRAVFGLGGLQLAATAAVVGGAAMVLELPWQAATVIGVGLALSSTAMVLPMLAEHDLLSSRAGRDGFSILLFQDLAIVPLVALLPLLAGGQAAPAWPGVLTAAVVVVAVLVAGRYLVGPFLRRAAAANAPEIFTAAALLVVVGTAAAVAATGLSASLGAFLAGVLLSQSQYRHQLKADIEPFEGLLLGLFFISVGMGLDADAVATRPLLVLGATVGLLLAKTVLVAILGRLFGQDTAESLRMGLALSQAGEFSFVLFGAAAAQAVLAREAAQTGMAVATLSMLATPLLFVAAERWLVPRLGSEGRRAFDALPDDSPPVIICGFGRVGQIIGRMLRMRGIRFTALDRDPAQVDMVRRFGSKVFFGDPTRLELLRAAGIEQARVLVLAIDDMAVSLEVARLVRRHFPDLQIVARARNRRHAHLLMDLGVRRLVRETFHSSVRLTGEIFDALGTPPDETRRLLDTFAEHDERLLRAQHGLHHDEERLIQSGRDAADELRALFEADQPKDKG